MHGQASLLFLLATGGLVALGCGDSPTEPDPPSFSVEPLHQWAGGQVRVTASGGLFEIGDVIRSGTDTLAMLETRTELVTLPLPRGANGPTTLDVMRRGITLGEVAVEAYGVEDLRVYPGRMGDLISDLPVPSGVSVVARSYEQGFDSEGGFVWIYPSMGMHGAFPGTPDMWDLFRVGVDPLTSHVYYEWRSGEEEECLETNCDMVHRARIDGGSVVDLGWVERPCNQWGCQPLAADIWIALDGARTCRVVSTLAGDACEYIDSSLNADDPLGIEYLWSQDVALLLGPPFAIRVSTGEHIYTLSDFYYSAAVDEPRGLFYLSARVLEWRDASWDIEIVTVRGEDGAEVGARGLTLTCPPGVSPPSSCWYPDLAYDEVRDLLYLLRADTRTLEARDPESFELRAQIALPDDMGDWHVARVLVDEFTKHVFVVFAGADTFDETFGDYRPVEGTPVLSVRLPPAEQ